MHCGYCSHIMREKSKKLTIIGILIALISLLFLGGNSASAIVGVFVGVSLAAYDFYTFRKRAAEARRSRPPLPLLPRIDSIKVEELLRGSLNLDADGHYHISTVPVEGMLNLRMSFSKSDRDRLQQYRKKYELTEQDERLHLGFAVLRGQVGLKFNDDNSEKKHSNTIIPLTGLASTHPFFSETSIRGSAEWTITRCYNLPETSNSTRVQVQLIPSLVQESAPRAINLELQWRDIDSKQGEATVNRIETFELCVPITWGEVRSTTDNAVIGTRGVAGKNSDAVRTISWRRLSVDKEKSSHTFFVRFENSIDLNNEIFGKVELSFDGALSGIEDVDLYYPLGGQREKDPTDIKTQIHIDFELSLAGLRYQDVRIIPDPKKEQDKEKQETVTVEGVIPDHTTVIALTNAMSDQGFYIKRVIENPPHTGGRANVVNRFWDVAGRYYRGVYPIEFHLIMTGEEVYSGNIRAHAGTTSTTLTVQGTYANSDMELQIENVWEQLNDLILKTLQQLTRAMPTQRLDEGVREHSLTSVLEVNPDANHGESCGILRKLLDQLLVAHMEGRLSKDLYLQIKACIEKKPQDLRATN